MPFTIPTLAQVRGQTRDAIVARLPGASAAVPNAALRVLCDAMAGLAYLAFLFLDSLAAQFLPDQAVGRFLDRWAIIYGIPRKPATFAAGTATFTGTAGVILPAGTPLSAAGLGFTTTADVTLGSTPTPVPIRAITAGSAIGLSVGAVLSVTVALSGVNAGAKITAFADGADAEDDDGLRVRVLERIRKPPQGGAYNDYEAWAREIPGVTRVWVQPNVFGPGSVGVRFMMDDLRAANRGFPTPADVATVFANIDLKRPVTVQDLYVGAPVEQRLAIRIRGLSRDTQAVRNAITASLVAMMRERAAPAHSVNGRPAPAQTIYAAWISDAILEAAGVRHFDLITGDCPMPNAASLAALGSVDFYP